MRERSNFWGLALAATLTCGASYAFADSTTEAYSEPKTYHTYTIGDDGGIATTTAVLVVEGGFYTPDAANYLASLPGVTVTVSNAPYDAAILSAYDYVLHYGNSFYDQVALETYINGGGNLIATPWMCNNNSWHTSTACPVENHDFSQINFDSPLDVTVNDPGDPLLAGVAFNNGDLAGWEGAATPRGGATVPVSHNVGGPFPALAYMSVGAGTSYYVNFHYITSDTTIAMNYGWGQQLLANIVQGGGGGGVLLCAQEVGPDVVVTLSGSLNLDATQGFFGTFNGYNGYLASLGAMGGPCSVDTYSLDVPNYVAYGPGGFGNWTSTTGDCVVMFTDPVFGVPAGYTDESPLSGTMTAAGQTFASLGWTPGVYVNTFTNGSETTTVTIQIGGNCGEPGDPTGACCIDNECFILTELECVEKNGGKYLGDDTTCDGDPCAPPDCPWDFNGDGDVGPPDLAKLLDNWGPCAPAGDCEADTCPYEFDVCGPGCVCFTLFDGSGFCGPGGGCGDPCPDGNCPPGFDCIIDSCCGEGPICATNPPCDDPAAPRVFEPFQMTSIGQADENGIVQRGDGISGGGDPVYIAATWSDTSVHTLDGGLNDLGSFAAGAANPNGIATDGNLIYTGHFSTQEVVAYDFSGAEQFRYNADLSGLQAMEYIPDEDALAFYRGGEIRFIDRATGTFIRSFPAQPGNCEGMCLCDGVLWLLQSPNINGVSVADGTLITSVPNPAAGCAFGGSGLACSGADELTAGCNDGSWWKFSKTDGAIIDSGNNTLDMFGLKTIGAPPVDCPWDFNGDGVVGPPDLAKLLDNWGPCAPAEDCEGQICGGYTFDCDPDNPNCVCYTLFDGTGFCGIGTACGEVCPDGNCPPGFLCVADTCCGPTTCLPDTVACELNPPTPQVFEPFQMTTLGQADKNGIVH